MAKSQKRQEQENGEAEFAEKIGEWAARKQHARDTADRTLWHSLGAIGTVGWTIGLPLLLGTLLGIWIDATWPHSPVSWTLALMIGGLLLGVGSALLWLEGEYRQIERESFKPERNEDKHHE